MATAIHKKQSESKYVTCFADSRPDVDITFRDVLLTRPTDHYLVGIDNFNEFEHEWLGTTRHSSES